MKSKLHHIQPLPPDASDEEVSEWMQRYGSADRVRAGVTEEVEDHSAENTALQVYLDQASTERNTAPLDMRVPPSLKALLARLARDRNTDPATLARVWLTERVRQEAQRKRK